MGHDLSFRTLVIAIQDIHMVGYTLAGIKSNRFVSNYQFEPLKKEDIQRFLEGLICLQKPLRKLVKEATHNTPENNL